MSKVIENLERQQLREGIPKFKAGDTVTVFGPSGFGQTNPVEIRVDAADGPVIGSFKTSGGGFAMWGPGTVTIPADLKPGIHTLWATQKLEESEKLIRGMPTKTLVQVLNPDGSNPVLGQDLTPQLEQRPTDLIEDKPVGTGNYKINKIDKNTGIVAQRYELVLFGNHQRLELQPWQPETPKRRVESSTSSSQRSRRRCRSAASSPATTTSSAPSR